MYIPPIDRNDPSSSDFGPVPENGEYELEVLGNAEGQVKSGANMGVPKQTVLFYVKEAGVKSSFHASIGSFSMRNLLEVLVPEFGDGGGDLPDDCLAGRTCLGYVMNEEYPKGSGVWSGKIRKLSPLRAAAPAAKAGGPPKAAAAATAAAPAPEVDPWG